MRKVKTITTIILACSMIFSFPVITKAETQNTVSKYDFRSIYKTNINASNDLNSLNSTFKEKKIEVTHSTKSNTKKLISSATSSSVKSRYSWNYLTLPFDFSEQTWSSNKNIFRTYSQNSDKTVDTVLLVNPKEERDYSLAMKEGYVDDAECAEFGMHTYKHVVTSEDLNDVTFMLEKNVAVLICDSDSNIIYNSAQQTGDTTYIERYATATKTIEGKENNVYNLGLTTGTYYFLIGSAVDNPTSDTHYAFYTGQPLPIKESYTVPADTHYGTINYNGNPGGLQSLDTQTVNIKVPDGYEDLYSIYGVSFKELYHPNRSWGVDHFSYFYTPPTSYGNSIALGMSSDLFNIEDNRPPEGSINGDYATSVMVTWKSDITGKIASCSSKTSMTVYYLAPYGIVVN